VSRTRVLTKPGLDGHDRGAQVVAMALRDAGMKVKYTGIQQSISAIVTAPLEEDLDVIGLRILSGAQLPLVRKLAQALADAGLDDKILVMGGTIPPDDVAQLRAVGVGEIFPVAALDRTTRVQAGAPGRKRRTGALRGECLRRGDAGARARPDPSWVPGAGATAGTPG
jgi:methylmalonyl-CoA mutase, C-terminal domain